MKEYTLILPLVLLMSLGNFIPSNYISYGNVTQTYKTYDPQLSTGLMTAYEYVVNNSRNSTFVVKIANYNNHTNALNVYNLFYGLQSKKPATQIPNSTLSNEFNFSQIKSIEKYTEFTETNQSNVYSLMLLLINNSVVQLYLNGRGVTPYSPITGLNFLVQNSNLPPLTTVQPTTTTPTTQNSTNNNLIYAVIAIVIIAIFAASLLSRKRSTESS